MKHDSCDIAIVGGGVTGTALLYALTRYSNVGRVVMIERREGVARVNSSSINNSQTLHSGEIETNFTLEKALSVKDAANLLSGYLERHAPGAFMRIHKMVIGVGAKEVAELTARYKVFGPHFPHLRLIGREEIAKREPNVVAARPADEPIIALFTDHGYAVNYQRLSESFLSEACKSGKDMSAILDREVLAIRRDGNGFILRTNRGEIEARAVAVCAGGVSLLFAHAMGIGKEYVPLPVAGSFYRGNRVLNGKVYTVQNPKIPFAAVHGDPAVYDQEETRFGPSALPLPMIERHRYRSVGEFLRTGAASLVGLLTFIRILWDKDIAKFAIKNFCYEIPFLGKWIFLRDARKIVPGLRYRDLAFERGAGGIRSQLVNVRTKEMARGTDKLFGQGIIFTMAPSPGASYCLKNAEEDAQRLIAELGGEFAFDRSRFRADHVAEGEVEVTMAAPTLAS